jgi:hypothetical protein
MSLTASTVQIALALLDNLTMPAELAVLAVPKVNKFFN